MFEREIVRKGSVSVTAAGIAAMKRMGVSDTLHGFPWKPGLVFVAQATALLTKNKMVATFANGVADAALAIYIEAAIANKTLVAGDEI